MTIYPSLPSGYTIFCDDVRYEISGKQTLVGTYGANMYLTEFPGILPQLYCVIVYRESPDIFGKVAIRVIYTVGEEDSLLAEVQYEVAEGDKPPPELVGPFVRREGRFAIQLAPFDIEGPGLLKVRALRGETEVALGALKIDQALPADLESEESEDSEVQ